LRSWTNTESGGSAGLYAAVAVCFLAITLLAAWLPARRASRLDPAMALRCE
jgi:ABC-type lipoprotein release transport system permease subunit